MSEEIVRYEDVVVSNDSASSIILAGWPTEQVVAIQNLLGLVVPQTSAATGEGAGRLNPFSERLSRPRNPADLDLIRQQMAAHDNAHLLVFVEDPATRLALELAKGEAADFGVVQDWQVATDRLLALVDADDPRISVVAIEDVFAAPHLFVEFLSATLDLPLRFARNPDVPSRTKWDDFYLLIASQYVHDHLDVRRLAEELLSRRKFVPGYAFGGPSRVDWSAVLQDVDGVRAENAALLEMLHKVQLEYEENMLELGRVGVKQQQVETALAEAQASRKEAEKRVRQLTNQLAGKEKTLAKVSKQARDRSEVIKQVRSSTSWKVTAPLRGVVSWFRK